MSDNKFFFPIIFKSYQLACSTVIQSCLFLFCLCVTLWWLQWERYVCLTWSYREVLIAHHVTAYWVPYLLLMEFYVACRLKHPAILELYSFFEDSNYVYLVLEMCHEGELYRYLKEHSQPFSEKQGRVQPYYTRTCKYST